MGSAETQVAFTGLRLSAAWPGKRALGITASAWWNHTSCAWLGDVAAVRLPVAALAGRVHRFDHGLRTQPSVAVHL